MVKRAIVVAAVAMWGCSGTDETATGASDPGTISEPFSTTPGEPNHEQITASGLSFLRPEIVTALQVANVRTDVEFFLVNANHFDDCNFSGGARVVRDSQAEAVAALDPANPSPEADVAAITAFARSLHALQDFYAHTNWIELGGDVLLDSSLGEFPALQPYATVASSGFVLVQGPPPKRAALTRDERAPYPKSAQARIKLAKTWSPALVSGTVDYEAGNYCPKPVSITHDALNKDKSTNVGRSQQYEAAKALAILQTEHEWCRFRSLTAARWGEAGTARLDAWISPGAIAPSCDP